MSLSKCPCNPSMAYQSCCQPLHDGAVATTPEQLMRSRYSAFALGLTDYLHATWHPSTRPALDLKDNPRWVQLQILDSGQQHQHGWVHFRAFYQEQGELQMLEERSRFVCEAERWLYLDGSVM